MPDLERRYNRHTIEVRGNDSASLTIGGYASVYDRYSDNLGGFVERVAPGFFRKSQGDGWPGVIARYNHDDNILLGTTAGGTLRLSTDEIGLQYDVDLPKSRADVFELVQRGDVRQSSFAFMAYEDEWSETDQGIPLRTLISGRLYDVAPVNTPAYPDSTVALRSLATAKDADYAEVVNLAQKNELRRLFVRTDAVDPQTTELIAVRRARLDLLQKR